MIDAKDLARSGCKYLGTPYKTMDCQKLWEKMLEDCGLKMDLGGSNSWYRYIMEHGWCGTPEECKKEFGCVPQGATLFIREDVSESTPEQFRHDGIGDITHMGDYTAMTGAEMVQIATEAGVKDAGQYNHGDGAIHSSSSRGGVNTSKFAGKTIPNGGWNRVGLFLEKIAYAGISPEPGPDPDPGPEPPDPEYAIVVAESGSTVKMRAKPTQSCDLYWDVPIGAEVLVYEWDAKVDKKGQAWSRIRWAGQDGYMMKEFLRDEDEPDDHSGFWTVTITGLTYDQAEDLCMDWGEATMKRG